jgi:hypothetical protein
MVMGDAVHRENYHAISYVHESSFPGHFGTRSRDCFGHLDFEHSDLLRAWDFKFGA